MAIHQCEWECFTTPSTRHDSNATPHRTAHATACTDRVRADQGTRGWMRGRERSSVQRGTGPAGWKSEQTGTISASVSHRATSRPDAALGRLGRQSRERRARLIGQRRSETPSAHDVITRDTVQLQGSACARTGSECMCEVSAPYEGRGGFLVKRSSRGDCYHHGPMVRTTTHQYYHTEEAARAPGGGRS